jgi:PAS domain S-box-containing protein
MSHQKPVLGYKDIFIDSPAAILILDTDGPAYTILDVNTAYLSSTNSTREELIGQSVFGAFPANPTDEVSKNIERTIFSFEQAITKKITHTMFDYRYDIPIRGTMDFEERYWTTSNTPVIDENGQVLYLIHSPMNVTELNKSRQREQASLTALNNQRQYLYATFMQAPVGIAIFRGPEYIVDLINPPLCEIYAKTVEEMIGKPVFDVLSHTRGLGFEELLDNVRLTGIPYKGQSLPAPLMRKGKLETVYLNFVYEPFREDDGSISGVIAVATEVTELVNVRKQIENAEERARLAAAAVGLGTFDLDLKTGEMVTSPVFAKIFGFDQPVERSRYISVFHPDDLPARALAHEKAPDTGTLCYEARVIWPDKSIHWVRVEGKVYFSDTEGTRILGTLLDITEQKLAREEQQKLITLVANSVDLMSILNMDGINSYINEAGRNMLGFETETQVTSTPISKLHAPEDFELVQKEVLPSVLNHGRWAGTMKVKHLQTGEIFPVFNNCIRIDDPVTGNQIATGAVMRDLRPELNAKKALAESEQLLKDITAATPTGLWMSDENGSISYVNKTWIDWTGISFENNLGDGWLKALHPDDRGNVKQKFLHDLTERSLYEAEFRIYHLDGELHYCIASGRPQYDTDGHFSGYIGACVDITVQKNLQRQKDDFIGIASHELKTPVTSIKAYTQVLERIMLQNGNAKEAGMMRRMDIQINRLTNLIGDLLDVTKINSGKLQFNDRVFDFAPFLHSLLEDLHVTSLKHQLISQLPDSCEVFGDRERIGQVITNLITNAIKYSPDSDKIVIRATVKADEISVCVQDFGIGISKENLGRVFEQFYRVSGEKQHTFPGLGLGLYISSEIIKREGGRIWVTSEEGKGSTFCFALPLKKHE